MHKPELWKTDMYEKFVNKTSWTEILPKDQIGLFSFCGFYTKTFSFKESQDLKIIILNTNLYYKTKIASKDPCGQVSNAFFTLFAYSHLLTRLEKLKLLEKCALDALDQR